MQIEIEYTGGDQAAAVSAVLSERAYQDRKWGAIQTRPKQVGSWLTLMRTCLHKAEIAWAESPNDHKAILEIRKVAGVALACLEEHGVPARDLTQPIRSTGARHD